MMIRLVTDDGEVRNAKVGFSWTVFFFGFLVPICRGDAKWAIIMFAASVLTLCLVQFVFCFTYNGTYIRELLAKGYYPADTYSRSVLIARGYLAA